MEEKEYCYPKGIKWTKQRKDVYHVLAESKEPLSATQIYQEILKKKATWGMQSPPFIVFLPPLRKCILWKKQFYRGWYGSVRME